MQSQHSAPLERRTPPFDPSTLAKLSEADLVRELYEVVFDSRKLLARLIAFLAEIERRRVWANLACTSLNDFCKRRLRMSHDAAHRRATAARLALR